MNYKEIIPLSCEEAQKKIHSGNIEEICDALVSIAFFEPDWHWAQSIFRKFVNHKDENVRGLAILCFGHLARIHQQLNTEIVVPIIIQALTDSSTFVKEHADSALDDVLMFCTSNEYNQQLSISDINSGCIDRILLGIKAIVRNDDNLLFAQEQCIRLSNDSNQIVRGIALISFADIANRHEKLDIETIMPILSKAEKEDTSSFVRTHAESAIDCIKTALSDL
ncbi:MAG: hypothetical protein FD167_1311 [bacterium]|nr:MAG: hypothetical protein FD167_1311 [bacterium]